MLSATTGPSDLADTWLNDYSWDAVGDHVACALGIGLAASALQSTPRTHELHDAMQPHRG